jgi:hypothetical protein
MFSPFIFLLKSKIGNLKSKIIESPCPLEHQRKSDLLRRSLRAGNETAGNLDLCRLPRLA